MKKETPVKYQSSANLFQFCRLVLDKKFGGIRVIDQDVGQILGFDPADCSHWKKGKKNIKSIHAMKAIADHLGVDERLVVDVANGEINDKEAFYELSGYGEFKIQDQLFDQARKEYYRRNVNTWTREKESEFRTFFDLNETRINEIVKEIHQKINFNEAPLYLPEIAQGYAELELVPTATDESEIKVERRQDKWEIFYPGQIKMRPYIRYHIGKCLAKYFLEKEGLQISNELGEYAERVHDIQTNLFAAKLLTPANLLRKELANVNPSKDIITQLADIFWVSKTFVNVRLKEILQTNPEL
ncbi:MAG: hypothetical protein AB7T49_18635 [Oligoflexales bacterium]